MKDDQTSLLDQMLQSIMTEQDKTDNAYMFLSMLEEHICDCNLMLLDRLLNLTQQMFYKLMMHFKMQILLKLQDQLTTRVFH